MFPYFPSNYLLEQCLTEASLYLAGGGTDQPTLRAMIWDILSRGGDAGDCAALFGALT